MIVVIVVVVVVGIIGDITGASAAASSVASLVLGRNKCDVHRSLPRPQNEEEERRKPNAEQHYDRKAAEDRNGELLVHIRPAMVELALVKRVATEDHQRRLHHRRVG